MKTFAGYGFDLYAEGDIIKLIKFFISHKGSFARLYPDLADDDLVKELSDLAQQLEDQTIEPVAVYEYLEIVLAFDLEEKIAAIINLEEGTKNFKGYPRNDDFGTDAGIMFQTTYPWEYNEVEKKFCAADVKRILFKYADEIGVPKCQVSHKELFYYDLECDTTL